MITKTVNLFTFGELSDKAKEKARDWFRECEAQDFGGHGELNEPAETAAKLLGIEFKRHSIKLHGGGSRSEPCIWWTLHVQGAGASFDGIYIYAKGSIKAVTSEFPKHTELQRIAQGLADIQKHYAYRVTALIRSDTRGHHLDIELGLDSIHPGGITDSDDESMRDLFRDFARWIYKGIEAEYDYRMSDEAIDDAMQANEYIFTESGKRGD